MLTVQNPNLCLGFRTCTYEFHCNIMKRKEAQILEMPFIYT